MRKKRASYGYKSTDKKLYCRTHSKENMMNVVSRKCRFRGCEKIPNYNYPNKIGGVYCKIHAKEGMVDVKNKIGRKDVKFTIRERLEYLVKIIKRELIKDYDTFIVKLIQLFYDDDYEKYKKKKKVEDITKYVAI